MEQNKTELDHLTECLAQLPEKTDWQMISLIAHHFRIPSGVGAEHVVFALQKLMKTEYKTLMTREPSTFMSLTDIRPGDTFTLAGQTCTLKKHMRIANRSPHLSGYFEFRVNGENFDRNMDYATAWSHVTDGIMIL